MTGRRDSFSKLDVTVTLSGEEWFALLSRLDGRGLSLKGLKLYKRAIGKLQSCVLAASCASLQQECGEQ
jgi:hypothetical protein